MPGEQLTEEQRRNLTSGTRLDVLDPFRVWCKARVLEARRCGGGSPQVRITYLGWGKRWDEWIDAASRRLQPWEKHTAGIWTGGPDFPAPGGLPCRSPLSRPCCPALKSTTRKASRRFLPQLVEDDYESFPCEDWLRGPFCSDDDKFCGRVQEEVGDEIRASGAVCMSADNCSPACADHPLNSDDSVICPTVGTESFSLVSGKSSEKDWDAKDCCSYDILSVASDFDIVSRGSFFTDTPESSDLSLESDEWEVLSSPDDLSSNGEKSTPYLAALLKGSTLILTEYARTMSPNRLANGTKSQVRHRKRLARIEEHETGETLGEDEMDGSDWLEDLRDRVKHTAGGKPDRRFKGNPSKEEKQEKTERAGKPGRRGGRRRLRKTCRVWTLRSNDR